MKAAKPLFWLGVGWNQLLYGHFHDMGAAFVKVLLLRMVEATKDQEVMWRLVLESKGSKHEILER